jgi:DNA-directed RNA polymerase subunit L
MFRNLSFDDVTNRTSFEIHDIDQSIVNGLRRVVLSELPVLGFQGEPMDEATITIHKNNGPLHNDFMTHRIGLLPIHFTSAEIESDAGALQMVFNLHVKNTSDSTVNVTTHDFTIDGRDKSEVYRLFPANKITKMPVLLTRLRKGEELDFTARVVKSIGQVHASFSPVSICTMSFIQDPKLAAAATNMLDKERAYLRNKFGDPTAFNFALETETGLSVKYIFGKAINVLSDKLDMVATEIKNADSTKVTMKELTTAVDATGATNVVGVEFTFNNEDDTLGNILQSLIHVHNVRKGDESAISYVGYLCPHPLEPRMLLTIRSGKLATVNDYITFLSGECARIQEILDGVKSEWDIFA